MFLLHHITALSLSPLWTRPEALALTNHPLLVQIGTGQLPAGSFRRCLLARTAIVEGLEAAAAVACSGNFVTAPAAECLSLLAQERVRCQQDADEWWASAVAAGKSIELPASEVAGKSAMIPLGSSFHPSFPLPLPTCARPHPIVVGVRCYGCGGTHYNVDCPEELTVSSEATALASQLRGSRTLAAASVVLRDLCFAHATLREAQLDGGDAYGGWVEAHSQRWLRLADACDGALEAAATLQGDTAAAAIEEARAARSLLFALIDSEASTAGLRARGGAGAEEGATEGADADERTYMSLQEAREAIEAVAPGFLEQHDRNARFLREEVLGASGPARAAAVSQAGQKASAVDKAAAYLRAKRAASGRKPSAAATAALLAARPGPKQAAAKTFLEARKRQQAAAEYLAAQQRQESRDSDA
jgi:hypothetical protein